MARRRIAFAGSATNPSHLGHLAILKTILSCELFDLVIWYPSGFGLKEEMEPGEKARHRQNLSHLTFPQKWLTKPRKGWAKLQLDLSGTMMPDVPTALRFEELRSQYPEAEITFITGSDGVTLEPNGTFPLSKWGHLEKLAKKDIRIIPRIGFVQPDQINLTTLKPFTSLSWLTREPHPDIRSSNIRKMIAAGDTDWKRLVPVAVRDYIELYQLYREDMQDG